MTEEINPTFNFYPHNAAKTTYEAQRKDRLGDSIGDYLTDEEISPKAIYEEMLSEVKTWVDYYEKHYKRSKALYDLMTGDTTPEAYI